MTGTVSNPGQIKIPGLNSPLPNSSSDTFVTSADLSAAIATATAQTTQLPGWLRARSRVQAGTGIGTILCIGNSTMLGVGTTPNHLLSMPTQLAARLTSMGCRATANAYFGLGGVSVANFPTQVDTRVTIGASWVAGAANTRQIIGGLALSNSVSSTSSAADRFTFNVTEAQFDTIEVYTFLGASSSTQYTVSVDAGVTPLGTYDIANSNTGGFSKTRTAVTLGTNAICVQKITAATRTIDLAGVVAYNTATPEIRIINAGIAGAFALDGSQPPATTSTGWLYTNSGGPYPWSRPVSTTINGLIGTAAGTPTASFLGGILPDLTILALNINDAFQNSNLATYQANMQTLITSIEASGSDCLLMVSDPVSTASTPTATQILYWNVVRNLAVTNNLALVDIPARWVSYAAMNVGTPSMYFDTVHPSATGYADISQAVADVLMR